MLIVNFFKRVIAGISGDKAIWALVTLLALFSFMPVFSASANLSLVIKNGTVYSHLIKHAIHIIIGFIIIYSVSKLNYKKFTLPIYVLFIGVVVLLVVAFFSNNMIAGANANRWVRIPFVNLTFQPSALAIVVLNMCLAQYLSKYIGQKVPFNFKNSILWIWVPMGICAILIIPANLSTGALLLVTNLLVLYLGKYPLKYTFRMCFVGILLIGLLGAVGYIYPNKISSRMSTWQSRIERFTASEEDTEVDNYQTDQAKIAIATGTLFGLGPGKSVQRNFLPQSSSDFIFAIIVEEYGLFGALILISVYVLLFFRFFILSTKIDDPFGKLLIYALGFPIIIQAFINMGVAVQLFPTTGQSLPLISSGGTSIWITCGAIGVILSVSKDAIKAKKLKDNIADKNTNDDVFDPTNKQVAEALKVVEQN